VEEGAGAKAESASFSGEGLHSEADRLLAGHFHADGYS